MNSYPDVQVMSAWLHVVLEQYSEDKQLLSRKDLGSAGIGTTEFREVIRKAGWKGKNKFISDAAAMTGAAKEGMRSVYEGNDLVIFDLRYKQMKDIDPAITDPEYDANWLDKDIKGEKIPADIHPIYRVSDVLHVLNMQLETNTGGRMHLTQE